jgi:bifunctional DNA-binding transcriptional regulator/antitoxin component of YhaV-PrlF toxin-antitoxin module
MKKITLSSRGRMTIPQAIRRPWDLSGARSRVSIQDDKIVLAPLVDLLGDLETEHQQEIEHDA